MKKVLVARPLSTGGTLELGLEEIYADDSVALRAVAYVDGELVGSEDFESNHALNPLAPRNLEIPHGFAVGYKSAVLTAGDIQALNAEYQRARRYAGIVREVDAVLQTQRTEGVLDFLKLLLGKPTSGR